MDCVFFSMLYLHCFIYIYIYIFSVSYCFACSKFQILFYSSQSVNFTKSNNKKPNDLITLYSKPIGIFAMHFFTIYSLTFYCGWTVHNFVFFQFGPQIVFWVI
jgi:hypothetical protein